jgi:hypothetical protein
MRGALSCPNSDKWEQIVAAMMVVIVLLSNAVRDKSRKASHGFRRLEDKRPSSWPIEKAHLHSH